MKKRFFPLFILLSLVLVVTSCRQSENQLAIYIPKDAAAVFTVDAKSITDKINASGITIDSLANLFAKRNGGMHWNDIKNSGIDLDKTFYVFTQQSSSMQNGKNVNFGLIAAIKDKNKVEEFLKTETGDAGVQSAGSYKFLHIDRNSIAGWNDNALIIAGLSNSDGDSSTEALISNLFALPKSNSIAANDAFNSMLSKQGDVHCWFNPSGSFGAIPMLGMTKINQLFEGGYSEGTIDFQKGKAVGNFEGHPNKTLSDMLQKYPPKEIKKDMVTSFPDTLSAFGVIAFNPKIITDILQYLGFDMMVNNYIAQLGFNISDVMNALSGDMAFMYSNSKFSALNEQPGSGSSLSSQFLISLQIGDRAAFDKVMTGLMNKNLVSKNGDQYQLGVMGGHGFTIETTNNALLISSDDALIKAYESGNNKTALPSDISGEMNNKSMAMYVDINHLLGKTNISDSSRKKVADMALSTFKDFIATSDKGDGKVYKSTLELNFVNKDENSLSSLVKFISVARNEEMNHQHDWMMHAPLSEPGKDSMQENKDSSNN